VVHTESTNPEKAVLPVARSPAFEVFQAVCERFNFSVERTKRCGMAPLTQFDWGCPLVKLGEQSGFHFL